MMKAVKVKAVARRCEENAMEGREGKSSGRPVDAKKCKNKDLRSLFTIFARQSAPDKLIATRTRGPRRS